MPDFSKYLGNDEKVLNAINMKDVTLWKDKADKTARKKSWMTLVVTNKRLFMISKKKIKFTEIRHEEIVATGWEYKSNTSEIIRSALSFILGIIIIALGLFKRVEIFEALSPHISELTQNHVIFAVLGVGTLFFLLGIFHILMYFSLRRTTLTISAKNGRDYKFLLRGKRNKIDEFRLSLQNAKDLSIEESENKYFTKMNTVLMNQMNYQKALYEQEREKNEMLMKKELEKIEQEKREYIDAKARISETRKDKMLEEAEYSGIIELDNSNKYEELPYSEEQKMIGSADEQKMIGSSDEQKMIGSADEQKLIEGPYKQNKKRE